MPLQPTGVDPLTGACRDGVDGVLTDESEPPPIVSISDIHGYLDAARSALTTVGDHPAYEPVVVADEEGTLHWADENYVLVFNGDLVDRGPANDAVLEMVARLTTEAPPGRVRVTLGNHEAIMLSPDHFGFSNWYSGRVTAAERETLLDQILCGHVVATYRGYNVTYAHAGAAGPYDASTVNDALIDAAEALESALGTPEDVLTQRAVLTDYERVLGVGEGFLKGPEAGLVWLDFSYLSADAPPQVVGHTRHETPTSKGRVHL